MPPLPKVLGWTLFETALGPCGLAWNELGICAAQLPGADPQASAARLAARCPGAVREAPETAVSTAARLGLQALLAGRSVDTLEHLPLDEHGVPDFHRAVYALTRRIPVGRTCSYGELAAALGQPGAARAVGMALGANPFAPLVPCHRVVGADGRLTGFSAHGGLQTKQRLLAVEARAAGQWAGEQGALF